MKTVFANKQVAHVWAQQRQPEGSNSGHSFYFSGPTIYSYGNHFPIASFCCDAYGSPLVLETTRGYSNTTAKHCDNVWGALHGLGVEVLHVPAVPTDSEIRAYTPKLTDWSGHARNVKELHEALAATLVQVARARTQKAVTLQNAESIRETLSRYITAFKLSDPMPAEISPELIAQCAEAARDQKAKEEAKRVEKAQAVAAEHAAQVIEWRNGEREHLPHAHLFGDATMLRLSRDGKRIQTSRGAEVPADVAPQLWKLVQRVRAGTLPNMVWEQVKGRAIGHFTLNEVKPDGSLVIGCHVLEFAELARMAEVLGLSQGSAGNV